MRALIAAALLVALTPTAAPAEPAEAPPLPTPTPDPPLAAHAAVCSELATSYCKGRRGSSKTTCEKAFSFACCGLRGTCDDKSGPGVSSMDERGACRRAVETARRRPGDYHPAMCRSLFGERATSQGPGGGHYCRRDLIAGHAWCYATPERCEASRHRFDPPCNYERLVYCLTIDDDVTAEHRVCTSRARDCKSARRQLKKRKSGVDIGFCKEVSAPKAVAACSRYIESVKAYARCSKLPQQARDAIRKSLEQMKKGFLDAKSGDPTVREAMNDACEQALDALEKAKRSVGC